jgi:hypothetical protein
MEDAVVRVGENRIVCGTALVRAGCAAAFVVLSAACAPPGTGQREAEASSDPEAEPPVESEPVLNGETESRAADAKPPRTSLPATSSAGYLCGSARADVTACIDSQRTRVTIVIGGVARTYYTMGRPSATVPGAFAYPGFVDLSEIPESGAFASAWVPVSLIVEESKPRLRSRLLYQDDGTWLSWRGITVFNLGPAEPAAPKWSTLVTASVGAESTRDWKTENWPADLPVTWRVVPFRDNQPSDQFTLNVVTTRAPAGRVNYSLTVTNRGPAGDVDLEFALP